MIITNRKIICRVEKSKFAAEKSRKTTAEEKLKGEKQKTSRV
jgi:hypothetical protein